jgi:nucleoid-associated protein YgaU
MQKDLKIGIVLGSVLAAVAAVWLSTEPSLSTKARMLHANNAAFLQEISGSSNNPSTDELTAEAHSPAQRWDAEDAENNQLELPDFTINEQADAKFHTVVAGETLSDISRKYYGSANRWQKILKANRETIKDANKLRPGTNLFIPE